MEPSSKKKKESSTEKEVREGEKSEQKLSVQFLVAKLNNAASLVSFPVPQPWPILLRTIIKVSLKFAP